MKKMDVPFAGRSYPIYIGQNLYSAIGPAWLANLKPTQLLLVSDENVFPLFGGKFCAELDLAGFKVTPVVLPAGEESKSLDSAELLYNAAIEAGLDRKGVIAALGGGVIGDLAGFVASTYLRGIPFVQVPTTLLAQVDSSVGGKVAVNHPRGKNLIGSFYQPKLVWAELDTLQTLPRRELLAGAAEVIKYGVILSEPFFVYLEENWDAFLAGETGVLEEIVATSCALKARVVLEDEREEGLRAILNFGHTLGHALETATAYKYYLHGEAVLAGMSMAVQIALRKSLLPERDAKRMQALFARAGLPAAPSGLSTAKVLDALQVDKKREGNRQVFVLPVRIGEVALFRDVEEKIVHDALTGYLEQTGSVNFL